MITCSRETELKLSHNTGMLDGIIMVAGIIETCTDKECSKVMVQRVWSVAQMIAANRARMLAHLLEAGFSLEEFVDSN